MEHSWWLYSAQWLLVQIHSTDSSSVLHFFEESESDKDIEIFTKVKPYMFEPKCEDSQNQGPSAVNEDDQQGDNDPHTRVPQLSWLDNTDWGVVNLCVWPKFKNKLAICWSFSENFIAEDHKYNTTESLWLGSCNISVHTQFMISPIIEQTKSVVLLSCSK